MKIVAAMKVLKSKSLFSLREKMLDGFFLAKFKKKFQNNRKSKMPNFAEVTPTTLHKNYKNKT